MIAAGLCLMGGCFAQDSTSKTVDTYWPAHAVTITNKTLVLKQAAADLPLPFWTSGVHAGGRIENVSITGDASNILNWGNWGSVVDAYYMGTKANGAIGRAAAYSVTKGEKTTEIAIGDGSETFVDYIETYVLEDRFLIESSLGNAEAQVKGWPTADAATWPIRIKGNGHVCDVVSFWWYNDLNHLYFMAQPMCSAGGERAFYTHGYSILTEL
ncbi:MAG: hypothetical protein IKW48_03010 [Akkermansia sp.]|nr:hypothetical protein [Akkermansia sp.]